MEHDVVHLTRELTYDSDLATPTNFHWNARGAWFTADPRGKYDLIVEAPPTNTKQPIHQWLYVRVIWDIYPPASGSDPTAVNAHVGYLVQTEAPGAAKKSLYYEGMGNVYVDRPGWLGGKHRFQIRHTTLRLTRSNRDKSVDPFGLVSIEADIAAGADPQSAERIAPIARTIESLPPPADAPPRATTSAADRD
ncbi:MAG: hypothetical protein PHU85_01540 [Phycisphaerae bacterium]|nr:hypothetical protein [Phycisphaerae bacterium]